MKYFLGKFRWEFYSLIKEKLQGKRNGRRLHYLTNFCLLQCNWSSWHFLKFRLKPKEALHILWEVKAIPLINSFNTSLLAYLFNPRILFLYWIRTHQNVFSIYVFCSICTEERDVRNLTFKKCRLFFLSTLFFFNKNIEAEIAGKIRTI